MRTFTFGKQRNKSRAEEAITGGCEIRLNRCGVILDDGAVDTVYRDLLELYISYNVESHGNNLLI